MNIFEKIINREIPAKIIWESSTHLAFLDIKPIQDGHTLVIPKKCIDYIFDMSDQDYTDLMLASKEVAKLLKSKLNPKRVALAVEGFGVSYVHVHLVPVNNGNELNPEKAKLASGEELDQIYKKIVA